MTRTSMLLHQGKITADDFYCGSLVPDTLAQWAFARELTFNIDVQSVVADGTPLTAASLSAQFWIGELDSTGPGLSAPTWFPPQDDFAKNNIAEGVGWYGGSATPPVGAAAGRIANLAEPVWRGQRTLRNFGANPRLKLTSSFTGGGTRPYWVVSVSITTKD